MNTRNGCFRALLFDLIFSLHPMYSVVRILIPDDGLECLPKVRAYIHTAGGFGLRPRHVGAAFWVRDGKTK